MQYDNFLLFDYLSLTAKHQSVIGMIVWLGMDESAFQPAYGRYGYTDCVTFENVSVYSSESREEVLLVMSGQGCRTFESYGHGAWDSLFTDITDDDDYNITRLDVAFDDHLGVLDLQQLYRETRAGNYVSKFKKTTLEDTLVRGYDAITIYHGSKKSSVLFRIYDKAAERGKEEDGHWVRFELQMRDGHALSFLQHMNTQSIGEVFTGVVNDYLRYVEPSEDSNKWRWPTASYWYNFIHTTQKLRLYQTPGTEYNLYKLERYAVTQAGAAAAAYVEIFGEDEYLERCREKLRSTSNPKYAELIRQHCAPQLSRPERNALDLLLSIGEF